MGYEYEVNYWDADKQVYMFVWGGEDFFEAIHEMNLLKASGKNCITLIWRP